MTTLTLTAPPSLPADFRERYPFGYCADCMGGRCKRKPKCVPLDQILAGDDASLQPCPAVLPASGLCARCFWQQDRGVKAERELRGHARAMRR